MRRVAVIGVGVTQFGRHDRTCAELFAEAAADAVQDAGKREAGSCQVDGARVGLVHTLGGNTATVLVSLFSSE